MAKPVFRTVKTVGPNELLRIYVILQDELNRFLCEEKDKLKQLIVKDNGEKVAKGDFTKQFNSIFGNTLLGVVDAWYYKILQSNIYDILLSLHDKKVIQQTLRENDNKINSKLWDMLKEKGLSYAPVRPPLQERRRMSEANHSLSKCGDIRAQIHIGPSQ